MTPDAFTDLEIVNVTRSALFSGNGGTNKGFCNAYQMEWWFENFRDNKKYPSPVVGGRTTKTYKLQFQRGVGDQDDGADMQLNVGDANKGEVNVAWIQARSRDNSSHYIQTVVQQPSIPGQGPFIVAFNKTGGWPMDGNDVGQLKWYARGQTIDMETYDSKQSLAIIDLSLGFPSDVGELFVKDILSGGFGGTDAKSVWLLVRRTINWPFPS
ncbi:hypothetical protein [Agrobacterium rosae]|uniref:hypothetical protein n=1 Tax=Agrobacterium rosae TaxID=1972867 RepID=UPI003A803C01